MSDEGLRTLERALAAGEERARVPLASAYLRQGRWRAAAATLATLPALPPEARGIHLAAWSQVLAGLAPVRRGRGVRAWGRLVGWTGVDERRAVLGGGGTQALLVDRETLELVTGPPNLGPVAAFPDGVLGAPPDRSGHSWIPEQPEPEQEPLPWALTRALIDLAPTTPWAIDPSRRLLAAHEGHELSLWRPDEVGVAATRVDLLATWRRAAPTRAAGARAQPRLVHALADGRVVVADPLLVLDPATGRGWAPDPHGPFDGPVRGAAGGEALLGFVGGRPARVPFQPGPRRAPTAAGEGSGTWHPFADVAATLPPWPRPAELVTADGQVLLRFPADARPLGFTPGGLSLLVLRSFQPPDRGALELWSAAGEEEGA